MPFRPTERYKATMRARTGQWVLAVMLSGLVAGCVERTLTITSEPPGALVYVSSVEVGRTPVKMPFTWYADYEVILRLQGYKTLKTHLKVDPPIYDVPPLDLLSELAPWTYHVHRHGHFKLTKAALPSDAELIRRADALRDRALEPLKH